MAALGAQFFLWPGEPRTVQPMDSSPPAPPAEWLPAELAAHTVESLPAMQGPDRRAIYWLILLGLSAALGSLPWIQVEVAVRAPGLVKARTDRVELKSAVAGRIAEVRVRDNTPVVAGQALLVIASDGLDEQLRRHRERGREQIELVGDLARLAGGTANESDLRTVALRQEYRQHRAQAAAHQLAEAKAESELRRYTALAGRGIATRQELDHRRYEHERVQAEARLFREEALTRWTTRWKEEVVARDELESAMRRLEREKEHHVLRAPVSGVLVGFTGWAPGGQMLAGQTAGAVSPTDALCVESQVSTRDIGLVRIGQRVRMQVDAFPHVQWGSLRGRVEAIGADLLPGPAGAPGYFKIVIRPEDTHLALANGVRGELRKGLTLTARYVVARRSLLQVLHEDASAWLNPQDASAVDPRARR